LNKPTTIRYESELAREFQRLIAAERELRWQAAPASGGAGRLPWLKLRLDDRSIRFKPVYSLNPSRAELEAIVASSAGGGEPTLLVTPRLSPHILEFCRHHQLCAVDLNGRAYLRAGGLLIDRRAHADRDFRFELEPRNVFIGKSARIVRTLLTDRDRAWVQSEVVNRAKASAGLVSRIVKHLTHQGFLEKTGSREFRLREPLALLDAWAASDDISRRATTARFSTFADAPLELAAKLKTLATESSLSIAFTQWIAGWLRHPYTEPVVVSAYVPHLPSDDALEAAGFRPVSDAGKVWLHVPDDEGVFLETRTVKGMPLVSDAQIYLDLLKTGLRGPDQAAALRNWEGFCRP